MSQRVNIQYSIDLEELPDEVERLVSKFGYEIERTAELYSDLTNDVASVAGLQQIDSLRMSLARADHILDDVNKIVTGYMQMSVQASQPQPEEQQSNPFTPNADTLNNLEEKLKAFSDRMTNEQSAEIAHNEQ
jgi:Na+/phosphate symporter|tara:strand:+ start:226 stop:624 length:399 start_codon:yes stop_codon:yes gene_type:complete